jgi:hypothetical protein
MIKVTVGGKRYDVKLTYSRIVVGDRKVPHDTIVEFYEEHQPSVIFGGTALLHPKDLGKFNRRQGRKLAFSDAIANSPWTKAERLEFWTQVMPLVRD